MSSKRLGLYTKNTEFIRLKKKGTFNNASHLSRSNSLKGGKSITQKRGKD